MNTIISESIARPGEPAVALDPQPVRVKLEVELTVDTLAAGTQRTALVFDLNAAAMQLIGFSRARRRPYGKITAISVRDPETGFTPRADCHVPQSNT